jgi:hypothetical protein
LYSNLCQKKYTSKHSQSGYLKHTSVRSIIHKIRFIFHTISPLDY